MHATPTLDTPRPDAPRALAGCRLHAERNGFLYVGPILETVTQRNSAVLCVGLTDTAFLVETRTRSLRTTGAALVGPGWLRLHGDTPVALLDVCPTDYHFRALARAAVAEPLWPRADFAPLFDELEAFRHGRVPVQEAGGLQARFLALALAHVPAAQPLDPRVRTVMRLLREAPGLPMAELAGAVDLSVDWLRRLFVAEVGIPLRRYEMTLRLQTAAAFLTRDTSLTDVAAHAGFVDLAHFSKVWKQHYGFAPRRAFAGTEVSIDHIAWPCFERSLPSAETRAVP